MFDYRRHRAVGDKEIQEEKLVPAENFTKKQLMDKEIVEQNGKQMVKIATTKKIY